MKREEEEVKSLILKEKNQTKQITIPNDSSRGALILQNMLSICFNAFWGCLFYIFSTN
jgi:hypothetical protein